MLSHAQRIDAARSAIDYITGRTTDEQQRPVPNCPGWTVYNAAAHIGRVGIAYFLPAMRRVTGNDPGPLAAPLVGTDATTVRDVAIGSDAPGGVTIEAPATQVLLALWGRPDCGVQVTGGDPEVLAGWRALPGEAFQFGTWD